MHRTSRMHVAEGENGTRHATASGRRTRNDERPQHDSNAYALFRMPLPLPCHGFCAVLFVALLVATLGPQLPLLNLTRAWGTGDSNTTHGDLKRHNTQMRKKHEKRRSCTQNPPHPGNANDNMIISFLFGRSRAHRSGGGWGEAGDSNTL
jgi:hypothetical protein